MRDLETIVAENAAGKRLSKPMDPHHHLIGDGQHLVAKAERKVALSRRAHFNTAWPTKTKEAA